MRPVALADRLLTGRTGPVTARFPVIAPLIVRASTARSVGLPRARPVRRRGRPRRDACPEASSGIETLGSLKLDVLPPGLLFLGESEEVFWLDVVHDAGIEDLADEREPVADGDLGRPLQLDKVGESY
jgi:hypothetical protein